MEAIRCCHDALSSKPLVLSVELTANKCHWDALLEMSMLGEERIDCLYLLSSCYKYIGMEKYLNRTCFLKWWKDIAFANEVHPLFFDQNLLNTSMFSGLTGLADKFTSFIREPVTPLGNAVHDAIYANPYGKPNLQKVRSENLQRIIHLAD